MAMGDLKTRLRARFGRRNSTAHSVASLVDAEPDEDKSIKSRFTARSLRSRRGSLPLPSPFGDAPPIREKGGVVTPGAEAQAQAATRHGNRLSFGKGNDLPATLPKLLDVNLGSHAHESSASTANFSTPNSDVPRAHEEDDGGDEAGKEDPQSAIEPASAPRPTPALTPSKPELSRRQSLLPSQQTRLIKTLLETDLPPEQRTASLDYFAHNGPSTISANMVSRKIWVKRPGASATLVTIHEDDLVDDVRDMILKKYANSLGRNFDAPDVTLRIVPREQRQERTLGPEEPMSRTLDAYYPGGQTVDEALIIDVPLRRTPKPSPRPNGILYYDEGRPAEAGSDYFPPMPVPMVPSPHLPHSVPTSNGHAPVVPQHAMSVLTTGHVPALPSPGSTSRRHHQRPRMGRTHTSSPTVISGHTPTNSTTMNEKSSSAPPAVPPLLPTPPAQDMNAPSQIAHVATPPPGVPSPRPNPTRKKKKKSSNEHPSLPASLLNGGVPPINVLIVEDNIINLKLLEAFMKRLKVRWQTAMNGKEAVTKWRSGGFHLVLMDIQLPIMSGLEATKEIRRLERLNSIGVFSSSASSSAPERAEGDEPQGEDILPSTILFKSPVIIVALTASSLQSDRHEALAAGCNDFLTKPVNFVWLERKVMEWGCMQALIDFDGWRKWKDFPQSSDSKTNDTKASKDKPSPKDKSSAEKEKAKRKKMHRSSLGSASGAAAARSIKEENEDGTTGAGHA